MPNARVSWGLILTGGILCVAGALVYRPHHPYSDIAEYCIPAGVPLVPLGLVLMTSFRRRTSPWLGAVIGLLLGAYVGTLGSFLLGMAAMAGILAMQGIPFRYLDQGVVFPLLAAVGGFLAGTPLGAIWCYRLWKGGPVPVPEAPSREVPDRRG